MAKSIEHVESNRYRATEEGFLQERPGKKGPTYRKLTNFTCRILRRLDFDDGLEILSELELEATIGKCSTTFKLPAADFEALNWVLPKLGPNAIVEAGYGVKDHVRAAIQQFSSEVPTSTVYGHLGWREINGHWVYLHAGGAIRADSGAKLPESEVLRPISNPLPAQQLRDEGSIGPISEEKKPALIEVRLPKALARFSLPPAPEGEQLVRAVRDSLTLLELGPDHIVLVLYAAIWRAALGSVDFSIILSGPTGNLKTTLASLAQQHWGPGLDPEHLPASWDSTSNYLAGLAFLAKDAILVMDDWVPTGTQADIQKANRDADRVLRAQGNQSGRGRCRPDGTPREAKASRCLPTVTAEGVPSGASLNARFFNIGVGLQELFVEDKLHLFTRARKLGDDGQFARAMAGYLEWVAGNYPVTLAEMKLRAKSHAAIFREHCRHPRTAIIAGELLSSLDDFLTWAKKIGAINQNQFDDLWARMHKAIYTNLATQNEQQFAEDPVDRFLELLAGVLLSGRGHIASVDGTPPSDMAEALGWRKQTSFLPKQKSTPPVAGEMANATTPIKSHDDDEDDGLDYEERCRLIPQGRTIGWRQFDELFLYPDIVLAAVQDLAKAYGTFLPFTPRSLGKALFQRKLLVRADRKRGRYTVRENVMGARHYFLMLRREDVLAPSWPGASFTEPGYEGDTPTVEELISTVAAA